MVRETGEVEVRGSSIRRKRQTVALPDSLLFIAAAINTAVLEDRDYFLHEFLDVVRCSWRLKRVVAAALCMKPRSMLTFSQARRDDGSKQASPEFASMHSLAMRFRGSFCSRDPGKLDTWIDDAVNSGLVAIERFARALHLDLDAVCNAIELPWSNGPAEGQINRLKTIKRAMYGRAGAELLAAEAG